ncbi:MAG TPA: DUF4258 domain-containing protein [Ktedonobacterales bacterium]|jgi:hypothetical protein
MDTAALRQAISSQRTVVTRHAQTELIADALLEEPVWTSMLAPDAEVIEDYADDPCGPSCLILSFVQSRPVHTVVAFPARRLAAAQKHPDLAVMITVYRPDQRPHEWGQDFRVRL